MDRFVLQLLRPRFSRLQHHRRRRAQAAALLPARRRQGRHHLAVFAAVRLAIPVGHRGQDRDPDDLHAVDEEQLEVHGDGVAERAAVNQRPEPPARGQGWPRRALHLPPHLCTHCHGKKTAKRVLLVFFSRYHYTLPGLFDTICNKGRSSSNYNKLEQGRSSS